MTGGKPSELHSFTWPEEEWHREDPENGGFQTSLLDGYDSYAASKLPRLLGFLLIRKGVLLRESYYQGAGRTTLFDVRSITKSFTGAAVGLALNQGVLNSLEEPVGNYIPSGWCDRKGNRTNVFAAITIRQLLQMTSGLYWKTGKKLGEAFIYRFHKSKDWLRFISRLPIQQELQDKFVYRSPDSHLLSCLLTNAIGIKMSDYLRQHIFEPLSVCRFEWAEDPQGYTAGHVTLQMSARDLAKLGLLYLSGGLWGQQRLLQEAWCRSTFNETVPGMAGFGDYGFQWWRTTIAGRRAGYAWGHGGSMIMVLPELESVVVTVSDPKVNRWRDPRILVEKFVIPAYKGELAAQPLF